MFINSINVCVCLNMYYVLCNTAAKDLYQETTTNYLLIIPDNSIIRKLVYFRNNNKTT